MSTRRTLLFAAIIILATFAYSFIVASRMPNIVPTHWNAAGKIDGYGSKWTLVILMPSIMMSVALMILALPKISPKKFEIEIFRDTFNYIMLLVLCMEAALSVVIIHATVKETFPLTRIMMAVLFLFFALMGNVLGKVRRNFFMGIKTPWTLADERVWDQTHRFAARLWTIGGVFGFLLSLFGLPFWFVFGGFMVMAIVPVLHSYFIYKKMDRSGTLSSQ